MLVYSNKVRYQKLCAASRPDPSRCRNSLTMLSRQFNREVILADERVLAYRGLPPTNRENNEEGNRGGEDIAFQNGKEKWCYKGQCRVE